MLVVVLLLCLICFIVMVIACLIVMFMVCLNMCVCCVMFLLFVGVFFLLFVATAKPWLCSVAGGSRQRRAARRVRRGAKGAVRLARRGSSLFYNS